MAEIRVVLPPNVPLHARPAGIFVRQAARYEADISVGANAKQANAKSILEVLALGATGGSELSISASGTDADQAVAELARLVEGLG